MQGLLFFALFLVTAHGQIYYNYCPSGYKRCGTGCVPNSYTCCSTGIGGCPSTEYCTSTGCCPIGETCVGPGGVDYTFNTVTNTIDIAETFTSEFISYSESISFSESISTSVSTSISLSTSISISISTSASTSDFYTAITYSSPEATSIALPSSVGGGLPPPPENQTTVPAPTTPPPASFTGAAAKDRIPAAQHAMLGAGLMAVLAL